MEIYLRNNREVYIIYIIIYFCLIIKLSGFSSVFYFAFCSPRAFFYFPLMEAASFSRYTYCHSRKLEFLSDLGLDNSPRLFWNLSTY